MCLLISTVWELTRDWIGPTTTRIRAVLRWRLSRDDQVTMLAESPLHRTVEGRISTSNMFYRLTECYFNSSQLVRILANKSTLSETTLIVFLAQICMTLLYLLYHWDSFFRSSDMLMTYFHFNCIRTRKLQKFLQWAKCKFVHYFIFSTKNDTKL